MNDLLAYLDDQYARLTECALLGDTTAVTRCRALARRRWLIRSLWSCRPSGGDYAWHRTV